MEEKKPTSNKINPVATGIAGVVIGAGITAAAAALQNKKTQQKVKKVLKTAGMKAIKYCEQLKNETKKQTKNEAGKIKESVKEKIKDIKET